MMTHTVPTSSASTTKTTGQKTEPSKPTEERARARTRAEHPNVDIYENEREFLVIADVPGATTDSLTVQFDRGELSFEATADMTNFPGGESTSYQRAFAIPDTVDSSKIDAELDAGVLRLRLPKVESAKPKQIPVRGA